MSPPVKIGGHRRRSAGRVFCLIAAIALLNFAATAGTTPLVIHEWGTFTSLQDESGQAIGGLNTDDEPVPAFVHRLRAGLVFNSTEVPNSFFKGVPRCDTDITMRLETPVLYFHPAAGAALPPVTVSAAFHGGWLSEYYPDAIATAPGFKGFAGPLRAGTTGTLTWPDLAIRDNSKPYSPGNWSGPVTTDHVWISPRAVEAADVRATNGEAERFIFYRGVAHLDSPISVTRNADHFTLHANCLTTSSQLAQARFLWLVDIAADGSVAFRTLPSVPLPGNGMAVATTPARFAPSDYSSANRDALRTSLHHALVAEGLFDDEADALLNTWQVSYFKSSGLRLFFMVPRTWTETYLPLKVSIPADITRVMVGRIELVTPTQRLLLHQIAEAPTNSIQSDAAKVYMNLIGHLGTNGAEVNSLYAGRESLKDFGVSVPPIYQTYLKLGRFRNALVLQEAKDNPTPGLRAFIIAYGLHGYTPAETTAPTDTAFF